MENKKIITKADERKALEQIKKIVEGLGENSYVGTAFKGVFELAEENIEYDAAFSAKFYMEEYDKASAREREWKEKAEEQEERCNHMRTEFSKTKNTLATFEKNAEDFYKRFREQEVRAIKAEEALASNGNSEALKAELSQYKQLAETNGARCVELGYKIDDMKVDLKAREEEIIRLKAKLYDLTVKE